MTVDHAGRALAVTEGFTGSTNDKTIIRCDAAVDKIRSDPFFTERSFDVYNEDGTTLTLKEVYLLVDNGYSKVNDYEVPHALCVGRCCVFGCCLGFFFSFLPCTGCRILCSRATSMSAAGGVTPLPVTSCVCVRPVFIWAEY